MKPINLKTWEVQALLANRKSTARRVVKPHNAVKAKRCEYRQGDGLWIDDEVNEWDADTHIKDYSVSPCWIGTQIYIRDYAPYRPGDILYVRETWRVWRERRYEADAHIEFKAGGEGTALTFPNGNTDSINRDAYDRFVEKWGVSIRWRPSTQMPKEAARLFLRVTGVRVERLQSITDDEALKEGIPEDESYPLDNPEFCSICKGEGLIGTVHPVTLGYMEVECPYCDTPTKRFANVWNTTLKPKDRRLYGWDANPWCWVIEFEKISREEALCTQT